MRHALAVRRICYFCLVCCLGAWDYFWRSIDGDTYWCQWIPPFLPFHETKISKFAASGNKELELKAVLQELELFSS